MIVAPRAGAWIETLSRLFFQHRPVKSHPVRVRGLKLIISHDVFSVVQVAPRAGAWIETLNIFFNQFRSQRRTPCGCVD